MKVNAWEDKFSERVNHARAEEVDKIRLSEVYKSANVAVFQATPLLGAAAVFCKNFGLGRSFGKRINIRCPCLV